MIDVVFQLLIFFLVAVNPTDLLSRMDIQRPSGGITDPGDIQLVEVIVHQDGYAIDGRRMSLADLDQRLGHLARFNRHLSVAIQCTGDSPHSNLVKLLDLCARLKMDNLNVFSL